MRCARVHRRTPRLPQAVYVVVLRIGHGAFLLRRCDLCSSGVLCGTRPCAVCVSGMTLSPPFSQVPFGLDGYDDPDLVYPYQVRSLYFHAKNEFGSIVLSRS